MSIVFAATITLLIVALGYLARSLAVSGAVAAFVVGILVLAGTGFPGLLCLGAFFVTSSILSRRSERHEPAWLFYPRYAVETVAKVTRALRMKAEAAAIVRRVERDPNRFAYTDLAITPVSAGESETLDLIHATAGGEAFLARKQKQDAILEAVHAARPTAA